MANWWESIRERALQIKGHNVLESNDLLTVAIVLCVGFSAFGLGRLSNIETQRPAVQQFTASVYSGEPLQAGGKIVASRNGTKYHFPWCAGAQAMNEENKVWFDSEEAARTAGYTPASNCRGLR